MHLQIAPRPMISTWSRFTVGLPTQVPRNSIRVKALAVAGVKGVFLPGEGGGRELLAQIFWWGCAA